MADADDMALRKQVAAQCRVVALLAAQIAKVHSDFAEMLASDAPNPALDELAASNGPRSATLMEALGDALNGMDAVLPEDDWTAPIFAEAQRRWPQETRHG